MSATKAIETGKFEGTFRWGNSSEVSVTLTRNSHGWFCGSVNGQEWVYPEPVNPDSGWGYQFAKPTALAAVRGFLKQWDACGSEGDNAEEYDPGVEPGTICTKATHLVIHAVVDAE